MNYSNAIIVRKSITPGHHVAAKQYTLVKFLSQFQRKGSRTFELGRRTIVLIAIPLMSSFSDAPTVSSIYNLIIVKINKATNTRRGYFASVAIAKKKKKIAPIFR